MTLVSDSRIKPWFPVQGITDPYANMRFNGLTTCATPCASFATTCRPTLIREGSWIFGSWLFWILKCSQGRKSQSGCCR